tara:strand:- start:4202 stop:4903 length:702 start_codon:yes stop_codon:yes gene_type:complete
MSLVFLDNQSPETFPDPRQSDAQGLVALSTNLGTTRLVAAYRQGIFPWMKMEQAPFLWCWYSPNPRMVLYPKEFKISRSLTRALKEERFEIRIDHNFAGVMRACASIKRPGQEKSWIEPEMEQDYGKLHRQGIAHSIEAYQEDKLVGGLYGLCLGKAFFGESMFHKVSEASKVCMAKLVEIAEQEGFHFIDCQVPNSFLSGLGAREIERSVFLSQLSEATKKGDPTTDWYSFT